MISLIKTEWLKLKKYRIFWWMLVIVALTYPGINLMFYKVYSSITAKEGMEGSLMKMLIGNPFAFPEAWHTIAYFSSWFVLVPSILIIMIISNEYTYKTNRQNVIDGWSRKEFILSKLFIVIIVSIIATLMFTIITIILGLNYSTEIQATRWNEQIKYVFLFLLQTFSQLSLAFFVGFIFKRSFIALGVFFFYLIIVEPSLYFLIDKYFELPTLAKLLPLELSDRLIPPAAFLGKFNKEAYEQSLDNINLHILYTVIFTFLIWLFSIKIYNKRDL
ncbi:MAG TPA: ABC transporter permease [Chitinophagaceae bacterium]|nr:ABC transporter permease [Chitinophagaceae bacterium]